MNPDVIPGNYHDARGFEYGTVTVKRLQCDDANPAWSIKHSYNGYDVFAYTKSDVTAYLENHCGGKVEERSAAT